MFPIRSIAYALACFFVGLGLLACGGASSSPSASSDETAPQAYTQSLVLTGFAQKGPFQRGSTIEVYELDAAFKQTGISFQTRTLNDYGEYYLPVNLGARYIELYVQGYFFDEISAQRSGGWLILDGIADTYESSSININLLTTLAKKRLLSLIEGGQPFDLANAQAQREVLRAFGITEEISTRFEDMNIFEQEKGDAALLAIASLVMQMAHYSGGDAVSATLSELIENIGDDLQDNGLIDDAETNGAISRTILKIRPLKVKQDLAARFPGMPISALETIINTLVYEYAYSSYDKYLISVSCVSNCEYVNPPLFTSLFEKGEFMMIVDDDGAIMGTFADNEGSLSGSVSPDGSFTMSLIRNYIVPFVYPASLYDEFKAFSGKGAISDTGTLTGTISVNEGGKVVDAAISGQVVVKDSL